MRLAAVSGDSGLAIAADTPGPNMAAFSFHIDSGEPDGDDTVPAAVLVQILQSAQQAFELIGIHVEGRSIRERARVSARTTERFRLVCQLPRRGCYAIPVVVGGSSSDLIQKQLADRAVDIFQRLMQRVSEGDASGLASVLPDERIRRRVLEVTKGMVPRAGARWTVGLEDAGGVRFATLGQGALPFLTEALVPVEQREAAKVVTGELKNIDFIEHKLTILYPPTGRALDCIYDEELEDLLYDCRRDLIQVTGRVVLDDRNEPRQIIDVSDIRDLDLSPLEIGSVAFASIRLVSAPSLLLQVHTDETKQLLCTEDAALGISAFAPTRAGLLSEVQEQLAMLWQEYALAADSELDGPARQLKQALRDRLREVNDAP